MDAQIKKRILEVGVFLGIMLLTFYALLRGQNPGEILQAVLKMSPVCLLVAVLLALFYVCAEGSMIWYLLRAMRGTDYNLKETREIRVNLNTQRNCCVQVQKERQNANQSAETEEKMGEVKKRTDQMERFRRGKNENGGSSWLRCIQYSFIGFFYSGITPSATGGQPVQLYYMNKDGNKGADSTVVLMTVAVVYKFVLVLIGLGILLLWYHPLRMQLQKYFWLYLLGLVLNVVLVTVLLGVMLLPGIMLKVEEKFEAVMIWMNLMRPSEERKKNVREFINSYQNAVNWLKIHPIHLLTVIGLTFLQRCSVFVLTYVVYRGFGLEGTTALKIILLQASVYIAVDMLPLPGAQGITELMYKAIFANIFAGMNLIPSMLVTRGLNFYFLLIVSLGVAVYAHVHSGRLQNVA